MAVEIKIKRSTGNAAPTTLQYGELAYSMGSDASKLYFGTGVDSGGGIMEAITIGGKYYTDKIDSGVTIGSTNISIGGTSTTLAGLTSVGFSGSTSGSSTLVAQAEAGTTSFVLPSTSGTLVGSGDTGTVTNTMLQNSSITINGTAISLGGSATLYANLSVATTPESNAFGDLTYNSETGVLTLTKVTTANIQSVFSAANSGTGYGSLAYADGVFTFTKVTDADIRGAISAGTGLSYSSETGVFANTGVVSITGTADQVIASAASGDVTLSLPQSIATTSDVTFNSVTISAAPSADNHAATKAYVDNLTAGLSWKNAVRVATTANITLSGTQTIDGVALTAGDRVLVKDQTNATENGIYIVASGAWTRASDMNAASEFDGAAIYVQEGTTWESTGWTQTATVATVGTDNITWIQFSGSSLYTWGAALQATGNTIDVLVDDSTIEVNGSDQLQVKDNGITSAKMAAGSVELATDTVTGVLPVANGGTGASTLAAGQLLIGDGTNAITTDSGLAWDAATDTLTVAGATLGTAADGTVTLSTVTTDADIIIAPNGNGSVTLATNSIIFDSTGDGIIESAAGDSMTVRGDAGLILESTTGDIEMKVAASDAYKVTVTGATPEQYSTGITDNDLVTAHWVNTVALDGGTY